MSGIPDNELKILIAVSGGRCAFPGCGKLAITESPHAAEPVFSDRQAFLVARSRQGQRGKAQMTYEERNHHSNLILLCPEHHALIDRGPTVYSFTLAHTFFAVKQWNWVSQSHIEGVFARSFEAATEQVKVHFGNAFGFCKLQSSLSRPYVAFRRSHDGVIFAACLRSDACDLKRVFQRSRKRLDFSAEITPIADARASTAA